MASQYQLYILAFIVTVGAFLIYRSISTKEDEISGLKKDLFTKRNNFRQRLKEINDKHSNENDDLIRRHAAEKNRIAARYEASKEKLLEAERKKIASNHSNEMKKLEAKFEAEMKKLLDKHVKQKRKLQDEHALEQNKLTAEKKEQATKFAVTSNMFMFDAFFHELLLKEKIAKMTEEKEEALKSQEVFNKDS